MAVRIVLADQHGVTREGLRILLEEKPGLEVVGEAQDGAEMVRLVVGLKPELVISEICMPGLNGLDAAVQLASLAPETRVVILTADADIHSVGSALLAGVKGYVLKSYTIDHLLAAIDVVMSGQVYLCPHVVSMVIADYIRCLKVLGIGGLGGLSSKQRQILQRIAEGRNTKQIALEMGLTPKAIEATRRRIMKAVGVTTVAGLVKFALVHKLTPL
ncbi:MAG: response regulator transcription factor [Sedimentisphaerales bacterium]|jgi:DNA-binding NarL/FixJ family response regulator|nr:response regulator transcription factor [Sedimentisphaerales bacterium]